MRIKNGLNAQILRDFKKRRSPVRRRFADKDKRQVQIVKEGEIAPHRLGSEGVLDVRKPAPYGFFKGNRIKKPHTASRRHQILLLPSIG
jgi:hypothetical protein